MTTYIYALFDPRKPEIYMYIGQTTQLHRRIKDHTRCFEPATKEWAMALALENIPIGFKILQETGEDNALEIEGRYLAELRPALNTQLRPQSYFQVNPIISLNELEGRYIRWALGFFNGNKLATAKCLGIGRQTLYNRMKAHGIES